MKGTSIENNETMASQTGRTSQNGQTGRTSQNGQTGRTSRKGQETEREKAKILEIAAQKMMRVGVRSVSIDDLCQEMGISKKTFYVYYESKEALIEDFLLEHEARMYANAQREMKNKSVLDIMRHFMQLQKKVKDVRQIPTLVYDLQKYYPKQFNTYLRTMHENVLRSVTIMLTTGQIEGIFREDLDIERTSRVFANLHSIMMDKMLANPSHPTIVSDTKYALDIFLRGIVSAKGVDAVLDGE